MTVYEKKDRFEKCHYCDRPGEYWDAVAYKIVSVCKYHLKMDAS